MTSRHLILLLAFFLVAGCSAGGTNPFLETDAGVSDDGGEDDDDAAGECAGCVDSDGNCVNGDRPAACGSDGRDCVECLADEVCTDEGVCVDAPNCTPDSCDGCCEEDGTCVSGDDDAACGRGGLGCEACQGSTFCLQGMCQRECGPDSCPGCCNEGECVSGETDTACGEGGGTCSDCSAIGAECDQGSCVEPNCAATCAGCCNEGECVDPAFDEQCGADGEACVACGDGRSCIDGTCTVDPASLWKVFIANGEVAMEHPEGGSWDGGFNGLPDPYVNVIAIDPSDDERHENYTATVDDTLAPTWDEAPVTAAARALFDGVTLEYIDDDFVVNDAICTIELEFDESSPAFDGKIMETECDEEPDSKLRWKLEAQ